MLVKAENEHTVEGFDDIFHADKHEVEDDVKHRQGNDISCKHGDKRGKGEEYKVFHRTYGEQDRVSFDDIGYCDHAA